MSIRDSIVLDRHRTAAKWVGSVAVIAAAAAVAGLSTFGTFTDSSSPVDTGVSTGVLSVDVSRPDGTTTSLFSGGLFVAGDTRSSRVDLVNDGDVALSSVTLTSRATSSSVLDSDPVNGLQLSVRSCSQPWVAVGSSFTCAGTVRSFYTGPMVVSGRALAGAASLAAGAVDHLLLEATMPVTATGDAFEGAESSLDFIFTGTQRNGSAR